MKILVDARSLGSKPSGIGIYIYNFVKQLAKYEDVEISLVTDVAVSGEMQKLSGMEGIALYTYGRVIDKSLGLFSYYKFVQKVIHKVQPDIFWEGNNLVPIRIKNPYGKFMTTVHDMFPIYMPDCYGKVYPYYFRYGMKKTVRQVDAIIYNSEETKKETEAYFPKAKNVKSFLSYIVVDCKQQTATADQDYLLYIGNLERRKGTDILLNAYREYREKGGQRKLILAGKFRENDIEEMYRQLAEEIDGVEYVGYADEDLKDKLLAECSCFVFPSRAEGFGIPVVEALIYGKPVLASKLSIFDEIVGDVVEYVECSEDEAIEKWAQNMLQMDEKKYIVPYENPYSAEILGEELYKFFMESTNNECI